MTVQEMYFEAKKHGYYWLYVMIDFLVHEKKVLKMEDNSDKITYYLQDKYAARMNEHLKQFDEKRKSKEMGNA
jgi:hypothetical protein